MSKSLSGLKSPTLLLIDNESSFVKFEDENASEIYPLEEVPGVGNWACPLSFENSWIVSKSDKLTLHDPALLLSFESSSLFSSWIMRFS